MNPDAGLPRSIRLVPALALVIGSFAAGDRLAGVIGRLKTRPAASSSGNGASGENDRSRARTPASATKEELFATLRRLANQPDVGRRTLDQLLWIKHRSADDCRALLEGGEGLYLGLADERRIVARWMELEPDEVMARFPDGKYLELLAIQDPAKAIAWAKAHITEGSNSNERDIASRLAAGLGQRDPMLARDQVAKAEGGMSAIDGIVGFIAARGTDYAIRWLKSADEASGDRAAGDLLYELGKHDADTLLKRAAEPENAQLLDYRSAIAAGLAVDNPRRALEWLQSLPDGLNEGVAERIVWRIHLSDRKHLSDWANVLPEEAAYDQARIETALDLGYGEGVEMLLKLRGPKRAIAFHSLFKQWMFEFPAEAAEWQAANASRMPPYEADPDEVSEEGGSSDEQ